MPALTPSALGPYALEHPLDHGGMSVVLFGRHRWLDRVVAVKLRARTDSEDEPVLRERFRLGALLQAELNHPQIAQVYDYLETTDHQALVMEYLPGGSIEDLLQKGVPPIEDSLNIIIHAADALHYAHERGIVHRDIKPANLLLADRSKPSSVRLNDFGVAHSTRLSRNLTQPGAHVGTLWYMPPEQFDGGKVDASSDIYSLAATLYELLTGTLPFERVETAEIFRRFLDRVPPPPIRQRNPSVPKSLAALVEQGLAFDASLRIPSAEAFALALRALALAEGINLSDGQLLRRLRSPLPHQLVSTLSLHDPQAATQLSQALQQLTHVQCAAAGSQQTGSQHAASQHTGPQHTPNADSTTLNALPPLDADHTLSHEAILLLDAEDDDEDDDHTLITQLAPKK